LAFASAFASFDQSKEAYSYQLLSDWLGDADAIAN